MKTSVSRRRDEGGEADSSSREAVTCQSCSHCVAQPETTCWKGAHLAEAMAADSLGGGRFPTWLRVCRPGLGEYCRFPVSRLVFNYAHVHTPRRLLHRQ